MYCINFGVHAPGSLFLYCAGHQQPALYLALCFAHRIAGNIGCHLIRRFGSKLGIKKNWQFGGGSSQGQGANIIQFVGARTAARTTC
jgi:hypothetical protein